MCARIRMILDTGLSYLLSYLLIQNFLPAGPLLADALTEYLSTWASALM